MNQEISPQLCCVRKQLKGESIFDLSMAGLFNSAAWPVCKVLQILSFSLIQPLDTHDKVSAKQKNSFWQGTQDLNAINKGDFFFIQTTEQKHYVQYYKAAGQLVAPYS